MLNNTDHMVSKLALWQFLKAKYSDKIAQTMIPYSWDLTDSDELERFKKNYNPKSIYITKNNRQRQEGLEIHTSLDSIIQNKDKYLLVQELLQNPYCVNGRKINLRVYVLIMRDTIGNLKIMIYKDGFMYYTPELFEKGNSAFNKNITTGYVDRIVYEQNPLTHQDFRNYLDNDKREFFDIEVYYKKSRNYKLSEYIFSQIYHLLEFIFSTYQDIIGTKSQGVNFQLYGVDVAIDDNLSPMIMEINKGPDLTAKDGRDKDLKIKMSIDILKTVGLLADDINNQFINVYELVNINNNIYHINNFLEK
jgi:hypothetical protein